MIAITVSGSPTDIEANIDCALIDAAPFAITDFPAEVFDSNAETLVDVPTTGSAVFADDLLELAPAHVLPKLRLAIDEGHGICYLHIFEVV